MDGANAVDVALPLPLRHAFTYALGPIDATTLALGARVRVPFGPHRLIGFVVAKRTIEDLAKLKPVEKVVDNDPLVLPSLFELSSKIAARWVCGLGEALGSFIPVGVKKGTAGKKTAMIEAVLPAASDLLRDWKDSPRTAKQKEILQRLVEKPAPVALQLFLRELNASDSPVQTLAKRGVLRRYFTEDIDDPFARLDLTPKPPPILTEAQAEAGEAVGRAILEHRHAAFLLQGVTGSGKTEVYLNAIARTLEAGRGAIVMVPEIALTPQTVERFASRFGEVAVLHSHLTDAQRAAEWRTLHQGKKRIAVGPRSAVFAPIRDLGLIVIDEEHDGAFKQQNAPRYHAREVAMMRGEIENAVVLLGSATPCLETLYDADRKRITRLVLPKRVGPHPLPSVSIVDMRAEKGIGPAGLMSPLLTNLVAGRLDHGEACLLFLNRRGYSTSALCRKCGERIQCVNCSIPLVYYKTTRRLLCHYCGHSIAPPQACPACKTPGMSFSGFGTEMVEHSAKTLFPKARVARMDGETMKGRGAHEEIFQRLKNNEIDILVGTQMIAKGLDLPRITLIGVISADTSLLIPDFRSAERTFQLMTQVAGRAGRGARPGRVLIQTYMPDHYSLKRAAAHDVDGFAEIELQHRREAGYPPFGSLLRIVVQGEDEKRVIERIERVKKALEAPAAAEGVDILGPAPAPIALLQKRHRHHLVLRADLGGSLERVIDAVADHVRSDKKIQVLIDRDPIAMM